MDAESAVPPEHVEPAVPGESPSETVEGKGAEAETKTEAETQPETKRQGPEPTDQGPEPAKTDAESEQRAAESEQRAAESEVKTESEGTGEPSPKKLKREDLPVHNTPPVHEMVGGSSVRQYLNKHLTAQLLEGLRRIAKEQPENPLLALGQYLIEQSKSTSHSGL